MQLCKNPKHSTRKYALLMKISKSYNVSFSKQASISFVRLGLSVHAIKNQLEKLDALIPYSELLSLRKFNPVDERKQQLEKKHLLKTNFSKRKRDNSLKHLLNKRKTNQVRFLYYHS